MIRLQLCRDEGAQWSLRFFRRVPSIVHVTGTIAVDEQRALDRFDNADVANDGLRANVKAIVQTSTQPLLRTHRKRNCHSCSQSRPCHDRVSIDATKLAPHDIVQSRGSRKHGRIVFPVHVRVMMLHGDTTC